MEQFAPNMLNVNWMKLNRFLTVVVRQDTKAMALASVVKSHQSHLHVTSETIADTTRLVHQIIGNVNRC